jgi:ankyrin repeat protein
MARSRFRLVLLAVVALAVVSAQAVIRADDRSELISVVRYGDREGLAALLKKGVDVNATEADGSTALMWASYRDDEESAALLIQAGAHVNIANELGATALWAASMNGSAVMVGRLLQAGANPNLALIAGETPVMVASRSGSAGVVEQLLAKGANVNARGPRGQTALMWAVAQRHPDVVKVLLAHGADVQARSDEWGYVQAVPPHGRLEYNRSIPHGRDTALMFAARVGDLESARLLVGAGANVNDADAWGVSALVLAAHSGFGDLV